MGKPGEKHTWWCEVCATHQPLEGGIRPGNKKFVCSGCATPELRQRLKREKSHAVIQAVTRVITEAAKHDAT